MAQRTDQRQSETPPPSVAAGAPAAPVAPAAAALFDRLVVPIDFSAASRAAFATAMRIADTHGSRVVLFHAAGIDVNDEFLRHTGIPWGRGDVGVQARDHLRRFADAVVAGSGARVEIDATRADDPVAGLAQACARHGASLVVAGSRPHDRRRLFRSTTERMVRALDCPVLVVRGEREPSVDADM